LKNDSVEKMFQRRIFIRTELDYGGLDENKKKLCGITQLFIYLSKY
jgi:hypothetical protein